MFKDYYLILKINESSSIIDIKNAFKKQAFRWHPDRNRGMNTTSEMQDINEAYLILKDDEARNRYDQEYQRFKQYKKQKHQPVSEQNKYENYNGNAEHGSQKEKKTNSNDTYDKEYSITDDTLIKWINNARRQAAEIVRETIEIASVGFKAFITFLCCSVR